MANFPKNRSIDIGSDRFGYGNLFELDALVASGLTNIQKDNLTAVILSAIQHFPNGLSHVDEGQQRIYYGRNYIQLAPGQAGDSPVAHAGNGPVTPPGQAGVLKRWTITTDGLLLGPVEASHRNLTEYGGMSSPFMGFDMVPSDVQTMIVSMLFKIVIMINADV